MTNLIAINEEVQRTATTVRSKMDSFVETIVIINAKQPIG